MPDFSLKQVAQAMGVAVWNVSFDDGRFISKNEFLTAFAAALFSELPDYDQEAFVFDVLAEEENISRKRYRAFRKAVGLEAA